MSITQEDKIRQVTEKTIVIGVDIASETHWARAFDWRGLELGKVLSFANSAEGFTQFKAWVDKAAAKAEKSHIIVGLEPTGHYWFTFAAYLKEAGMGLVLVSPMHVKRTKELDDNDPSKSDRKDPKTIAKLVNEGRYIVPYIPEGVYAELRICMNCRWRVMKELASIENRVKRWFKIYFPEYGEIFGDVTGAGSMALLHEAPLPSDLLALGADGINQIWRARKLRAVGKKRAQRAIETAERSVGCKEGLEAARMELRLLLEDYDAKQRQYDEIMEHVELLCAQIPEVERLLKIKGLGIVTIAGILAEAGDLRRFDSPRQVQKLAGLGIKVNESGKQKGKTGITHRGRKKLRAILFRAALPLVRSNPEFRALHQYFTTRELNPLKKKQSIIAVSCKLLRVFFVIATKGCEYNADKLLADIHRNQPMKAAA